MRRFLSTAASVLLGLALAGPAIAANPNRAYEFTACWTGTQIRMEQTWSAINVDSVTFGVGDGLVGVGEVYDISRSRSGDEISTISPPEGSTIAAGSLLFHGKVVISGQVEIVGGGTDWSAALDPC